MLSIYCLRKKKISPAFYSMQVFLSAPKDNPAKATLHRGVMASALSDDTQMMCFTWALLLLLYSLSYVLIFALFGIISVLLFSISSLFLSNLNIFNAKEKK